MKIYISIDMEGVTGVTKWDDVDPKTDDYKRHIPQMNKELQAAIRGAKRAGATEILVRDAHCHGDNVDIDVLESGCKLIRGWCGDPYSMVQGIDSSFDGAIFLGYHSGASSDKTPLAHTESRAPYKVSLNGNVASEFDLYSNVCIEKNVKVLFVSGDKELCQNAKNRFKDIYTVETKEGIGNSVIHDNPVDVIQKIESNVEEAIRKIGKIQNPKLESSFTLDVTYKEPNRATRHSFFPGVTKLNENTLRFESEEYFEILRTFQYIFD